MSVSVIAGTLSMGLQSGVLIAVPVAEEHAVVGQQIDEAIQVAVTEARCTVFWNHDMDH